jgi:hypothetical protein
MSGSGLLRRVAAVTVTNPGSGYTSQPAVTFSSGSATATASLTVRSINLTSGGSGYTSAPAVAFSPAGASATATVSGGAVTAVTVNSGGTYTAVPTVAFTGGNSAFAIAASSTCTSTLAVGASCQVNVTFAPTAVQAYSSGVNVTATGATITPATNPTVPLTGAGVASRATVSISPNPLTITLDSVTTNPLDPADYTLTSLVTLTNTCTAPATCSGVSVTGFVVASTGGPGAFTDGPLAGPDNCTGATLPPGGSCSVSVRFTVSPTAARGGANGTGTITFTDTASGSPQVGQLIGVLTP